MLSAKFGPRFILFTSALATGFMLTSAAVYAFPGAPPSAMQSGGTGLLHNAQYRDPSMPVYGAPQRRSPGDSGHRAYRRDSDGWARSYARREDYRPRARFWDDDRRFRRYDDDPFRLRLRGNREPEQRERGFELPNVHVASPQYHSYRADKLERMSLGKLAEVQTASNDTDVSVSGFSRARLHLADMTLRVLPEVGAAILEYYLAEPDFLWVSEDRLNAKARQALQVLGEADSYGLDPAHYAVALPQEGPDGPGQKALAEFEMKLSAAVLTYVLDARRGRIDPNRISGYHDFERKTVNLTGVLTEIAGLQDVEAYLEGQNPQGPEFSALRRALLELRDADAAPVVKIKSDLLIRPGERHEALAQVVEAIRKKAPAEVKNRHAVTLTAYGGETDYSRELVALVKDVQRSKGLKVDGIIGPNTVNALTGVSNRTKINRIELAMERLRWLPRDLGSRHVLINQPAFTATYKADNAAVLSMPVVVGTKSNQTSFFSDKIETVEYNPYWNVPRSIIINEMLPKLARDPGYLDRKGYEIVDGSGRKVSSRSVDWYAVAKNRTWVDVRQPPGNSNALGRLKILFPNRHAIYMHDTPQKQLFGERVRAFSHGCIRLKDPEAMAAAVLGTSRDHVRSRVAAGSNRSESVPGEIKVHVAYFTAWPEADGTVAFYNDVYERDDYLNRAIERTAAERLASS